MWPYKNYAFKLFDEIFLNFQVLRVVIMDFDDEEIDENIDANSALKNAYNRMMLVSMTLVNFVI